MAIFKLDTKVCAYPPEVFLVADNANLQQGDNNILEYTSLKPKKTIISVCGISTQQANARLHIISDNIEELRSDISTSRGIDINDEVRISAADSMLIKIYSSSPIDNFASRYLIKMDKATPVTRKYYNLPLDSRDLDLLSKYNLTDVTASEYNPYSDNVYKIVTTYSKIYGSGVALNEKVKPGEKISILDISVNQRPTAPDVSNITISRDGLLDIDLDAYCMPTISLSNGSRYVSTCKMTAIDELRVSVSGTETIGVRLVYLVGKLTLEEKVRWGLKLNADEQRQAEAKNLFELAEVGLI